MTAFRNIFTYLSQQRWPAILWTLAIIVACTLPGQSLPDAPVVGFDKVVHIGMFVGWAFLWMMLFPEKTRFIFLIGIFFGILLEFYQQLLPFDRSFDWWDALADGVGTLAGTLLFLLISRNMD
jgi:hypothetical protein